MRVKWRTRLRAYVDEVRVRAVVKVLPAAVRYGGARVTALLMRLALKRVQRADRTGGKSINLMFLQKMGHSEDVLASFGGFSDFGLLSNDRRIPKTVCEQFLPEEIIDDNNYLGLDPDVESKKRALRAFWVKALRPFLKMVQVDAVTTGNFSYAAEQELAAALEELGVPVVVLHKECLNTPRLEEFYEAVYRQKKGPFHGSLICTYNEGETQMQIAAGVSAEKNFVITGMPRLDAVHQARVGRTARSSVWQASAWRDNRPMILFFSFNAKTGLPFVSRKTARGSDELVDELERLTLQNLMVTSHHLMLELARNNPDIDVVIKTKGNLRTDRSFESTWGNDFSPPENLHIIHGMDPVELIQRCTVVCGINSTALLEAIAMNKPVIVPRFDEACHGDVVPYIIDLGEAVQYADSPKELEDKLIHACKNGAGRCADELNPQQIEVLEYYGGNSDGHAGTRVREAVTALVQQRRNARR
jgi:hypothetical protein